MEKKLDKQTKDADMEFIDEPEETMESIFDENDAFPDNELKFNEDGDLIFDDEIEPTKVEPEKSPEPEVPDKTIEQAKVEEVQPDNLKSNRQLTAAEIKVINLKKENQALQAQLQEFAKAQQALKTEQEKERLRVSYEEQGYDKDTAQNMSANEIRIRQLEEKIKVSDFREQNFEVFEKYPQAKENIFTIMKNSEITGMTAEQICKGLYGTPTTPEHENRAVLAAKGQSTRDVGNTSTNIIPTLDTTTEHLSKRQITEKAWLEKLNGGKLTMEEYKKYSRL